MSKEFVTGPEAVNLEKYKERLETGVAKAQALHEATNSLLHAESPIDPASLPFTLLPKYDFQNEEDPDRRFDAQLHVSDILESVTEKTIPVLAEKLRSVTAQLEVDALEKQVQLHEIRVIRMRDRYAKGFFPLKSLEEAEEKLAEKVALHQEALMNLPHVDTPFIPEPEQEILQPHEESALTPWFTSSELVFDEQSINDRSPQSTLESVQTEQIEKTPEEIQADREALAEHFYDTFFPIMTTQERLVFYQFLTDAIRKTGGEFTLDDCAEQLYYNPGYHKNARSYIHSQKKDLTKENWEIVSRGKRRLVVRKIQDEEEQQVENVLPTSVEPEEESELVTQSETQTLTKKQKHENWRLTPIDPTRIDTLTYLVTNSNWTVSQALDIIGPSKIGRRLTWVQASRGLAAAVNRIYSRVAHNQADDQEKQLLHDLSEVMGVENQGKALLVELRTKIYEQFKARNEISNDKEKEKTPAITRKNVEVPIFVSEPQITTPLVEEENSAELQFTVEEVEFLGALISEAHGATIQFEDREAQLSIDEDILESFSQYQDRYKVGGLLTFSQIQSLYESVFKKARNIFDETDEEKLNTLLEMQSEEAYLLLYSVNEMNQQFDGLLFDFLQEMGRLSYTTETPVTKTWHAPYEIPLVRQEILPEQIAEEVVEVAVEKPEVILVEPTEPLIKIRKIEKEIPDLRLALRPIIEKIAELPEQLKLTQLRAIHPKLSSIAGYAIDHRYIKMTSRNIQYEFNHTDVILLQFLYENHHIQKQPKLVREVMDIIKEEHQRFIKRST